MATNTTDTYISGARGVDVYPGIANPTEASVYSNPMETNFVNDPTDSTVGAGAGENFAGHKQAARTFKETAGVVEGRPGVIESSNIDPLNENSNQEDGWANARSAGPAGATLTSSVAGTAMNAASGAATAAAGAARMAYGHAVGDEAAKRAGKESLWGKQ